MNGLFSLKKAPIEMSIDIMRIMSPYPVDITPYMEAFFKGIVLIFLN